MVSVEYALEMAFRGYPVFPCAANKKTPVTKHGFKDATLDEEIIRSWWKNEPGANIGIATEGLLVIDIDTKDWPVEAAFREDLARAPMQCTPRGGTHHIFRQPPEARWRSSQSSIAPKVDVRADGGYFVVAPSTTPDGAYRWISDPPLREKLPLPPRWLIAIMDDLVRKGGGGGSGYQPLGVVPAGKRHGHLLALAGSLAHQGLGDDAVRERLRRERDERCAEGDHPVSDSELESFMPYVRLWREIEHGHPSDSLRLREQLIAQALRHWSHGDRRPMVALLDYYEDIRRDEEHPLLLALAKATARYPEGDIEALAAYVEDTSGPVDAGALRMLVREEGPSDMDTFERRFGLLTQHLLHTRLKTLTATEDGRIDVHLARALERRVELVALLRDDAEKAIGPWNNPELETMEEAPAAIIDRLLYPGLTFVSGKWKECFKTTITTALIQHVAQGLSFLGRTTRQMRCGFVQLDTPFAQFCKIAADLRTGMNTPVYTISGWRASLDLTRPGDRMKLSKWVQNEKIELLAIDSLSSVFRGNENHADEVKPVLRGFFIEVLRDSLGSSLIILAHPNRAGTSTTRGSGDWEAAADSNWRLTAKVHDDITESVTISVSGRHPPQKLTVALDFPEPGINGRPGHAGITIREVEGGRPQDAPWKSPGQARTMTVLQEAQDWLSTQAVADLTGCALNTVKPILAQMFAASKLDRRDRHERGGGSDWRWREEPVNSSTPL